MDMYVEVLERIKHQYELKAKEIGLIEEKVAVSQEVQAAEEVDVQPQKGRPKKEPLKKRTRAIGNKVKPKVEWVKSDMEVKPISQKEPKMDKPPERKIPKAPAKSDLNQKEKAAVIKLKMEKLSNEEVMESLNITEDALMGVLNECKKFGIKF